MMLSTTGNVYLWGSGSEGQLGMGPDVVELPKPVMLEVNIYSEIMFFSDLFLIFFDLYQIDWCRVS